MLPYRLRQLAATPFRLALYAAGRAYVPGYRLEDALAIARRVAGDGMTCTLGYFHGMRDTPETAAQTAVATIEAVAALQPPGYVSLKAPAFGYDLGALAPVLEAAKARGVLAHFDSHQHDTAQVTLACLRYAVAQGAATGLTVPGRWQRSPDDAAQAAQLGVRIRIVKGEWADPGAPGLDPRQGFLAVVDRLAGLPGEVAIGTHDPWLARESIRRLQAAGTPCELELLNGLPRRPILALAREFAVPVRLYIPFGLSWRPYAMRKAAENPRILWWVMRDAVAGLWQHLHRPPR